MPVFWPDPGTANFRCCSPSMLAGMMFATRPASHPVSDSMLVWIRRPGPKSSRPLTSSAVVLIAGSCRDLHDSPGICSPDALRPGLGSCVAERSRASGRKAPVLVGARCRALRRPARVWMTTVLVHPRLRPARILDAVEGTVPLCCVTTALSGSREKANESIVPLQLAHEGDQVVLLLRGQPQAEN